MATSKEWGTLSLEECLSLNERRYTCPTCHKDTITIREAANMILECSECRKEENNEN